MKKKKTICINIIIYKHTHTHSQLDIPQCVTTALLKEKKTSSQYQPFLCISHANTVLLLLSLCECVNVKRPLAKCVLKTKIIKQKKKKTKQSIANN